ncbi:MAG: hypothetical protein MUC83_15290 [Pirellula sp.]|jgi:hypothetical protein|nr:hypothetical protein [Pirellula sp.]
MDTRKSILQRLDHINLGSWSVVNDLDIDDRIRSNEKILKSKKFSTDSKISSALYLTIYQLWGIPSKKFSLEEVFEITLEAGKEFITKPHEIWLSNLMTVMLIASLQPDDTELIHFSNWFKVEKHALGDLPEIAFLPILYQVADIFRARKFRSFEKLDKYLEKWRVKVPPMLLTALEGIRKMDSKKTFDTLLAASLDHATRTNIALPKNRVINECYAVAIYPSLLWNVAELRGLEPPTMPPEIRPFMLTRQTLGLPPIQPVITSKASKPKVPKSAKAKSAKKTAKAKNAKRNSDDVT